MGSKYPGFSRAGSGPAAGEGSVSAPLGSRCWTSRCPRLVERPREDASKTLYRSAGPSALWTGPWSEPRAAEEHRAAQGLPAVGTSCPVRILPLPLRVPLNLLLLPKSRSLICESGQWWSTAETRECRMKDPRHLGASAESGHGDKPPANTNQDYLQPLRAPLSSQ